MTGPCSSRSSRPSFSVGIALTSSWFGFRRMTALLGAFELCAQQVEPRLADDPELRASFLDPAEVDVRKEELLVESGCLGDELSPRIDDVRAAPEVEPVLAPDPVGEDDVALEHP